MTGVARRIPDPLHAAASASPDSPAISSPGAVISYAGLDRCVSAASEIFRGAGCGAGTRVAFYLDKDERYFMLLLALIRTGGVACLLSTRTPPERVHNLLQRAGCQAIIAEDEDTLRVVGNVEKLNPDVLLAEEKPVDDQAASLDLDAPATIVFTSGSTGTPKAALHTLGNHYYNALGSNENITLGPGDRWLHSLPLYHVGGLSIVFRCLISGATIGLPEPGAPVGREISRCGATHVSLVATQLLRLLRENKTVLEGLKAILLGGSAMPNSLVKEASSRGLPVHTSYGLTEMASQVTTTPPDASPDELRTSGKVLPHRELAISKEGEILVRGETLFAGYLREGGVERPLDPEGWFHTGDLGELDGKGYLRVTGRRDNMFISGGENIQPEEIEAILCRFDGVEQAVIVPLPDEEFGERPVAFVRTSSGDLSPERFADALGEVLPRFKIPVAFYGWPEDASSGMKVDRKFFRELARKTRTDAT